MRMVSPVDMISPVYVTSLFLYMIGGTTPTVDAKDHYIVGSLMFGKRTDLTRKPQYPISKEMIEPVLEKRFDAHNNEVEESGEPYSILNYNWKGLSAADLAEFHQIEAATGARGMCGINEKWDDYEAVYIAQRISSYKYPETSKGRHSLSLRYHEAT